jgi:acetyl esterase/lipase
MGKDGGGFHPELAGLARFLPAGVLGPRTFRFVRFLGGFARGNVPAGIRVEDATAPGPEGAPTVRVRVYRPEGLPASAPALLWMHGGGFLIGAPEQDDALCAAYAEALGCVVASVDYRLAPEHPFPAPLEDCFAALTWLHREAAALGVDPARVAVGGASAGGGLAAGLALLAHDRGVPVVFQLLVYPMIDDRTTLRTDVDGGVHRVWNQPANAFGWASYLGRAPGGADVPDAAAPARRADLSGLPPAWIGVGTFDLFHDEDLAYAARLRAAGVPVDLEVVPGAFHGFDAISAKAAVSRAFHASQHASLRRAFG